MPENLQRRLRRLMASKGVKRLPIEKAFDRIGSLIDLSKHLKSQDGTTRALEWCDELQVRDLSPRQGAQLEYFRANTWANRVEAKHRSRAAVWQWEQPELQNEVLCLRRALAHKGFGSLPLLRRSQIFTNLGNQLSYVGRFVDAIEYWGRALDVQPRFAMAVGNRGWGRLHYAQSLYDTGHRRLFLLFAYDDLNVALSQTALWDGVYTGAKELFQEQKKRIEKRVNVEQVRTSIDLHNHSLGRLKQEQRYRRWCLANNLFLNPLNDLGPYPIAAQDVLMLPTYTTSLDEGPTLIGFFNQLKQEYASARWFLYEGAHASHTHFSDRGVKLYDTLDYTNHALAVEKMKIAFRVAYSLFDKTAYFLNDYMRLGIPEKGVYFRSLWYEKAQGQRRELRVQFVRAENWPWRGLYWLAKDFVEEEFRAVMEPDSQALYEIRNHLEHKYLKVHEMLVQRPSHATFDPWSDRLACSISRSELKKKTLRLLKLSRAALIYLALGMHREERLRAKGQKQGLLAPVVLGILEDSLKR